MVGPDVILIGEAIFLSQFLDVIKMSMFTVPFLAHDGYDRMDDLYRMGRVKIVVKRFLGDVPALYTP